MAANYCLLPNVEELHQELFDEESTFAGKLCDNRDSRTLLVRRWLNDPNSIYEMKIPNFSYHVNILLLDKGK